MLVNTPTELMEDTQESRLDQSITYHNHVDMTLVLGSVAIRFGEALQRCRTERNLSQESLAFQSDVDRVFISHIEQGKHQPTITTIVKLAGGLGMNRPGNIGDCFT